MWTRKEVKKTGNQKFRANYWFCVLAALILSIALSGSPGVKVTKRINTFNFNWTEPSEEAQDLIESTLNGIHITGLDDLDQLEQLSQLEQLDELLGDGHHDNGEFSGSHYSSDLSYRIQKFVRYMLNNYSAWLAPLIGIITLVIIFAASFGICLKIFLLNPLELGGRRFFLTNLSEKAKFNEMGFGFTNNYLDHVLTLFIRDLKIFLWTLLFVIPGIIKSYEYRMVPYILAEDPQITRADAFARSREMMQGNKWDAFVLDLSFLGWDILSALTAGILGLFFVKPYKYQTMAALYDVLKTPVIDDSYDNYIEVE